MRMRAALWLVVLSSLLVAGLVSIQGNQVGGNQAGPNAEATAQPVQTAQAPPPPTQAAEVQSTKPPSVRFAAIGDDGNASREQYEVAAQMMKSHATFPFDFVVMLGDNLYGGNSPNDYKKKFEQPYKPLLDAGIKFYASLGNHDNSNERFYEPFNMGGQRYYTFKKENASFFVLDSNYMDPGQLAWLEQGLKSSDSLWKICYFHHPLYSDGKAHGPDPDLRARIEPLFMKYGVNLVLSGHEHFYERIQPQHGIYYFIEGSSGELRPHNIRPSSEMIKGFDTERAFLLIEIAGDKLTFRAISRTGDVVDSGDISAGRGG